MKSINPLGNITKYSLNGWCFSISFMFVTYVCSWKKPTIISYLLCFDITVSNMTFSLTSSTAVCQSSHDKLSVWPCPRMEVALSAPQSLSEPLRRGTPLPLSQLVEENRGKAHTLWNPLESSTVQRGWVCLIAQYALSHLLFCVILSIFRNLCQTEKQQTDSSRTCRASLQRFWTAEGLYQNPGGNASFSSLIFHLLFVTTMQFNHGFKCKKN